MGWRGGARSTTGTGATGMLGDVRERDAAGMGMLGDGLEHDAAGVGVHPRSSVRGGGEVVEIGADVALERDGCCEGPSGAPGVDVGGERSGTAEAARSGFQGLYRGVADGVGREVVLKGNTISSKYTCRET